jgi:GGDEF domain-containing protein
VTEQLLWRARSPRPSRFGDQRSAPVEARDHYDPLTGFANHDELVADLAAALEPGRPPSVVAVFELVGAEDYCTLAGPEETDALIARYAKQFARIIEPAGTCYRPRKDEFCALIARTTNGARATLVAAELELNHDHDSALVAACFGAASLPDDATDPTDLLMLADRRLRLRMQNRKPRERRRTPRSPTLDRPDDSCLSSEVAGDRRD